MAETGIKGIDLYYKNGNSWQYVNTARPSGKINEFLLINNMKPEKREYKMYLPLYDGIISLEIGMTVQAFPKKPDGKTKNRWYSMVPALRRRMRFPPGITTTV